ncbi:hypothetical protein [Roseiflexus sp.]|uniref:hypothetical protein n=1 Tax=Roseiflexus sp. TaxID=2562120 RepID=UPI00398B8AEF
MQSAVTIDRTPHEAQVQFPPIDPDETARQLDALPTDKLPAPGDLPPSSRLHHMSRNPLFVGREEYFAQLATALRVSCASVAVTGIGGVGKSSLAIEFVHCYGRFFAGVVFWLNFSDPAGIPAEINACGGAGGMRLADLAHLKTIEERVQREHR